MEGDNAYAPTLRSLRIVATATYPDNRYLPARQLTWHVHTKCCRRPQGPRQSLWRRQVIRVHLHRKQRKTRKDGRHGGRGCVLVCWEEAKAADLCSTLWRGVIAPFPTQR